MFKKKSKIDKYYIGADGVTYGSKEPIPKALTEALGTIERLNQDCDNYKAVADGMVERWAAFWEYMADYHTRIYSETSKIRSSDRYFRLDYAPFAFIPESKENLDEQQNKIFDSANKPDGWRYDDEDRIFSKMYNSITQLLEAPADIRTIREFIGGKLEELDKFLMMSKVTKPEK